VPPPRPMPPFRRPCPCPAGCGQCRGSRWLTLAADAHDAAAAVLARVSSPEALVADLRLAAADACTRQWEHASAGRLFAAGLCGGVGETAAITAQALAELLSGDQPEWTEDDRARVAVALAEPASVEDLAESLEGAAGGPPCTSAYHRGLDEGLRVAALALRLVLGRVPRALAILAEA
jgi:hypothetical protein